MVSYDKCIRILRNLYMNAPDSDNIPVTILKQAVAIETGIVDTVVTNRVIKSMLELNMIRQTGLTYQIGMFGMRVLGYGADGSKPPEEKEAEKK